MNNWKDAARAKQLPEKGMEWFQKGYQDGIKRAKTVGMETSVLIENDEQRSWYTKGHDAGVTAGGQ